MKRFLIIGGGAAGMLSSVYAARNGMEVHLFEQNEKLGKKLFITGKGRCNFTNGCATEELFESFITNPRFLYSAVYGYTNYDVIDFFETAGVKTKMERGGRMFPLSDHSSDIIRALEQQMKKAGVKIHLGSRVKRLLVEKEEDALAFIEEMKKKYWDARHNCYVYSVGKNREYTRCSDDGEPSGTAGRPMLDVILGEDIYNVAAVVTRYFGGVLLGTGGLVRAYSKSLQEGLAASTVIEKTYGISMEVITDYTGIGRIQYIAGEKKLPILDSEYTDRVVLHLLVPSDQIASVEKAITEGTNGKAKMKKEKDLYYAVIDGEVRVFAD